MEIAPIVWRKLWLNTRKNLLAGRAAWRHEFHVVQGGTTEAG